MVCVALLMCGGRGKRLGMGEKPLVRIGEKRLIDYILDELWFLEVYGVTTEFSKKTEEYLRRSGVRCVRTSGRGFIEDYLEAILKLGLFEPVLIASADLVILERGLVMRFVEAYYGSEKPAMRVVDESGKAVGINLIDGMLYDTPQPEDVFVVGSDKVININTPNDLMRALCLISKRREG